MLLLSQTAVKDLEREDCCPLQFKARWIDRSPELKLNSEDLDKGKYFEYLVIGAGAIQGDEIIDLPRLITGNKSVDQLRIEAQAARCKRILFDKSDKDYLGFRIINTQLTLSSKECIGTLDLVAHDSNNEVWVIDLKLTKDLSSDRTKYGWGNDWSELDLIQQTHYEDLYYINFGIRPKMGLLVLDYSPAMRVSFGEIIISEEKRKIKDQRFKAAELVIEQYKKSGWSTWPSEKECQLCPISCKDRVYRSPIVKTVINY